MQPGEIGGCNPSKFSRKLTSLPFLHHICSRALACLTEYGKGKGIGESHVHPYVGKCLLERTLILSHRYNEVGWPVSFLAAFSFPSVTNRYPFAAGWTMNEHTSYDRKFGSKHRCFAQKSSYLATGPFY